MSTPKLNKVRQHLAKLAPNGITLPAHSLAGGWSEEVKDDGKCHYFTLGGTEATAETGMVQVASLCGRYTGEGRPDELDDLDPLAPENCMDCRRLLLQAKGLI